MIWSVALFPGNPTTDGIVSIALAQQGIIDSHSTASYGTLLYLLTFKGQTIILWGFTQVIVFIYSIWLLLRTVLEDYWVNRVMFYLSLSPLLMPIAWTHTHDVLAVSGFFIGLSLLIEQQQVLPSTKTGQVRLILLYVFSAFLMSMHFNILFVLTCLLIVQLILISSKRIFSKNLLIFNTRRLAVLLILTIFLSLFSTMFLGENTSRNTSKVDSHARSIMLADLACTSYLSDPSVIRLGNERRSFRDTLHGCDIIFEIDYTSRYVEPFARLNTIQLAKNWFQLIWSQPLNLLIAHYNRSWPIHLISVVPPYQDWDPNLTILPNPPKSTQFGATFLSAYDGKSLSRFDPDTNIYPSRDERKILKFLQNPIGLWNKFLLITGNSGFLLLACLLLALYGRKWGLDLSWSLISKLVVIVSIANTLSLTLISPAPEVRYTYPSLLLIYCLLFQILHKVFIKLSLRFEITKHFYPQKGE
jgi:hypothetical protein